MTPEQIAEVLARKEGSPCRFVQAIDKGLRSRRIYLGEFLYRIRDSPSHRGFRHHQIEIVRRNTDLNIVEAFYVRVINGRQAQKQEQIVGQHVHVHSFAVEFVVGKYQQSTSSQVESQPPAARIGLIDSGRHNLIVT